jgi:predicted DNA-binding transcriptional regulator AlpA
MFPDPFWRLKMQMIGARQVRGLVGNISEMTLWRWKHNERLAFPKPIVIQRRRYWRKDEVTAWLNQRALVSLAQGVL